jgi:hypothetical protein
MWPAGAIEKLTEVEYKPEVSPVQNAPAPIEEDTRKVSNRCKLRVCRIVSAWGGEYCHSCNAEIAERYHRHYAICGASLDDPFKVIRNAGRQYRNCGGKYVIDAEFEGKVYEAMAEREAR